MPPTILVSYTNGYCVGSEVDNVTWHTCCTTATTLGMDFVICRQQYLYRIKCCKTHFVLIGSVSLLQPWNSWTLNGNIPKRLYIIYIHTYKIVLWDMKEIYSWASLRWCQNWDRNRPHGPNFVMGYDDDKIVLHWTTVSKLSRPVFNLSNNYPWNEQMDGSVEGWMNVWVDGLVGLRVGLGGGEHIGGWVGKWTFVSWVQHMISFLLWTRKYKMS
jgi:hypothetical protein